MAWRIPRSRPFHFRKSTSGLAALEFALILPIMTVFLLGGYEVVRAINSVRRLTILANAIGQQITANTSGSVTNADLHFFYNTAIPVFPEAMKDANTNSNYWWQNIDITMSSITFTATPSGCTSSCTYTPSVVWTGGVHKRPCTLLPPLPPLPPLLTPLTSQSDQAPPDPNKLPADVFGLGSLIVVDLIYTFKPSIGANYFPTLSFKRSVYLQPRYVSTVYYSGITGAGSDDIAQTCLANTH